MATPSAGTPGLCYVTSKPKDSTQLPDDKFNAFYDNEHVPDILRHGFSPLALRYKNADPTSKLAYLALYPQDDVANVASPATAKMMEECRFAKTLEGQDHHGLIEYGVSAWTKIQTFEGRSGGADVAQHQEPAQTLVAVTIEPSSEPGAVEDIDAWYREEHLPLLAECRGYRRCTRYWLYGGEGWERYLALHEYDCLPARLPEEQIEEARSTEWSRRVLGGAMRVERVVWALVGAQGEVGRGL